MISAMYTLDMSKYVYVQVHSNEKPAKIQADKVEERKRASSTAGDFDLVLSSKGEEVGKFRGHVVAGWWIQEEGEICAT